MPKPLKEFIKEQLKVDSPGPGRFFTSYKAEIILDGDTDLMAILMAKYDGILKGIGDGQPKPETVKEFFTLVDSSLEAIFAEIQQEDPSIILDEKQKADIKYSIIFKFPGYLLKTKPDQANLKDRLTVQEEYSVLNGQSPVLTKLAREYFVNKSTDIAANMKVFYGSEYQKVLSYFTGVVSRVDSTKISNVNDLAKEIKQESNLNFKALPQTYKAQLFVELWSLHLAAIAAKAKANPYAISLMDFDDMVVTTLSTVPSTTVESMAQTMTERHNFTLKEIQWMKTTPISDVVMGNNYADESDSSMIYFNISAKGKEEPGLKLSSRASTHHEFRGEVLREMITQAQKDGSQQSVYDAFQGHIRTVKNNDTWIYVQTGISGRLLPGDIKSPNGGFAQGFDPKTPVYEAVKNQVIERLLMFASKYSEALTQSSDLLEQDKLTAKGKTQCETILNEINAQKPFPDDLVKFLKAYQTFEQKLKAMEVQLESGKPFERESAEHTALQTLHDNLNAASSKLKSAASLAELPDGKNRKYNLNNFKQDCENAVKEAERSALQHHRGWWANIIKPLLIAVAVCCTAGTVLASETVRNAAYEGFFNVIKETEGIKKVADFKEALQEIKGNADPQFDEPQDDSSLKI